MSLTIEIKANVRDWDRACGMAEMLAGRPSNIIDERYTFFVCPGGRLELREFSPGRGELVGYYSDDSTGTRTTRYLITQTTEPAQLCAVLSRTLEVLGTVKKLRHSYQYGQTRIHLEEIEGLGKFLELEVVLAPGQEPAAGEQMGRDVAEKLGVKPDDVIPDEAFETIPDIDSQESVPEAEPSLTSPTAR